MLQCCLSHSQGTSLQDGGAALAKLMCGMLAEQILEDGGGIRGRNSASGGSLVGAMITPRGPRC